MRYGFRIWIPVSAAWIMLTASAWNPTNHSATPPAAWQKEERWLLAGSGICPQPRGTRKAPGSFQSQPNPLRASPENIQAGKTLYHESARPTACRMCHGTRGNGNGRLAQGLEPAPRNFTCASLMETLSDGQLFWIIKHGSPGTAMPAHGATLEDRQIWQLIWYLRKFAK